jgi:hypothetical protein
MSWPSNWQSFIARPAPTIEKREITVMRMSLVDQLAVYHPPVVACLQSERAMLRLGLHLTTTSLGEMEIINAEHRSNWLPLVPTLTTRYWPDASPDDTFCIVGRDQTGNAVTAVGARLFNWTDTTMREELSSLRVFYGQKPPYVNETCIVSAKSASKIRGKVAFIGGFWISPDYRGGKEIPILMAQLSQAYALARWGEIDFCAYIMTEAVHGRGLARKIGWNNIEWAVDLQSHLYGRLRFVLIWQTRKEVLDYLSVAKIDPVVINHHA